MGLNLFGKTTQEIQQEAFAQSQAARQRIAQQASQNSSRPSLAAGLASIGAAVGQELGGGSLADQGALDTAFGGEKRTARITDTLKNMDFNDPTALASVGQLFLSEGKIAEGTKFLQMASTQQIARDKADGLANGTTDPTNRMQDIRDIMKHQLQCEIGDKGCYAKAALIWGEGKVAGKNIKTSSDLLLDDWKDAKGIKISMNTTNRLLRQSDNKNINWGTGSGVQTFLGRAAHKMGWGDGTASTATDSMYGATDMLVAELLGSGIMGSGTGVSDNDVKFLKGVSGGRIELGKATTQRILSLRYMMDEYKLGEYNETLHGYTDAVIRNAGRKGRDAFSVFSDAMYTTPGGSALEAELEGDSLTEDELNVESAEVMQLRQKEEQELLYQKNRQLIMQGL